MTAARFDWHSDKLKFIITAASLAIATFLTFWLHIAYKTEPVYTHFFYVPIIMASFWCPKRGMFVALYSSVLQLLVSPMSSIADNLVRVSMFIFVSFVTATLSESRTKRQTVLKESEKLYRSLFENMLNGFAYCRMLFENGKPQDFIYLAVNDAFESLTGLKDVVGRKVSEVIPGIRESDPQLFEIYGRVAMTGQPEHFEMFVEALQMWFSISVYSPAHEHFVAVFDVITERKRAETALRESEARYLTILETVQSGIVVIDYDTHTIVDINPMAAKMIGETREQIIGSVCYHNICPAEEGKCPITDLKMTVDNSERVLLKADGTGMPIIKTVAPVTLGGRRCLIETFVDITERKKSEGFIKSILESIGEGFVAIDHDYRIITANSAYCEQNRMPLEDIINRHCYEISHHIDKPCYEAGETCAARHTFATGEPCTALHTHYDKEGSPVYVETKSFPMVDQGGTVISVIEIANDITERKNLEDQLRQAQKMEAVGQLAGGIAHDFNNILSAIVGYGYVTLMKMAKDDPLRYNIEQMLNASDRAAQLTHSILAYSRKQVLDRRPIDLNELIRKVEKYLNRIIGEDIRINLTLSKSEINILADSGQLEQVFMNLATNARDAMPKGGLLCIETSERGLDNGFITEHGYGTPGEFAVISVSDSGMGMDEQTRTRIFEPFFTTKEVGKGTGLGLAMVYGTIKQHNGYINVYSEPGKGTTFRIYLPVIASAESKERKALEVEVPERGGETILLAEDDKQLRELISSILQDFGYTVIAANNGEDAVKKFMENRDNIQLLLFDLVMPKKNGKEAYDEIRAMKPDVRIMFMSGYAPDIILEKGIIENGMSIISKPVSPVDLLKKIRSVLDGGKQ